MKKILLFLSFFFVFFIIGCDDQKEDNSATINALKAECERVIVSGDTISEDVDFPFTIEVEGYNLSLSYSSDNKTVLSDEGKVTLQDETTTDVNVTIAYSFYFEDERVEGTVVRKFTILSKKDLLEAASEKVSFPEVIRDNITLPKEVDGYEVEWKSSDYHLSKKGVYSFVSENTNVTLTATFIYGEGEDIYFFDKEYEVVIGPYEAEKCLELVSEKITLAEEFSGTKMTLKTDYGYNVEVEWVSNSPVIDSEGNINDLTSDTKVKLTAVLTCEDKELRIDFEVMLLHTDVHHVWYAEPLHFEGTKIGVTLDESNYLVLEDGLTKGTFESDPLSVYNFTQLVGSWNAETSETATVELEIAAFIDGAWTQYLTYGEWGFGRENVYYDSTSGKAKMNIDIFEVKNGFATQVKFKVTLRRDNASCESPRLKRVALTFNFKDYSYNVDVTNLPNEVDYNVPKVYQLDVPKIGNIICSATTTAMLLKYHNIDLSSSYDYEHEYIAKLVCDHGHDGEYGNWSYNMALAGEYLDLAYTQYMYSWEELQYHLATYGPVGASIKGTFAGKPNSGHLIVVRGYKIVDGEVTVICNDPYTEGVYYEATLEEFMRVWRKVVYVVA